MGSNTMMELTVSGGNDVLGEKLRANRERWQRLGEKTADLQEWLNRIEQKLWCRYPETAS
jgi:hypothetical protein